MGRYLDILNAGREVSDTSIPSPGIPRVGTGMALAPVPATPALTAAGEMSLSSPVIHTPGPTPVISQFRSVTDQLQSNANMGVQQEILRICNLPIINDPTPEEIKVVSEFYIFNPTPPFHEGLFLAQVKAMMQFHDYGNLFCPVPVAGGKTLISVLVANDAYRFFGKRKILLMNPVNLIDQLRCTELPLYRRHMSINLPFYWLTKETKHQRMLSAKSNRGGCYVVSYSLLSSSNGAELMDAIQPDLIIGDEIHRIASARSSARNRRFKEIVNKYSPSLVVMSGTITKKSPKDYHWIASTTLKENCFMPRPHMAAESWSDILDCKASSMDDINPNSTPQSGPIMLVNDWAAKNFNSKDYPPNLMGFRKAAKTRMQTAPGVISSKSTSSSYVPLRISNIKIEEKDCVNRPGWEKLQGIVDTLINEYIAPNGDEIDHAMHIWRWRYELEGFGFYNNQTWPEVDKVAASKGISFDNAEELLCRSMEHHEAKQEYARTLRKWVKHYAKTGLDTPMLIGNEMYKNGDVTVGGELYSAWIKARELKFEGILERQKSTVRVCDFRINKIVQKAISWHKKYPNKAAIVWYYNREVGEWLNEEFIKADLPSVYCPSGKKGVAIIADSNIKRSFTIASSSYTEGQNLQHIHDTEFFAQWYRQAYMVQQAMGRIDRPGQKSDQARYFICIGSEFDELLFASTLNDAAYTHQINNPHKLMYADYDERPKVIPTSVLMEWSGGEQAPMTLSSDKQKMLLDKFKGE